MTHLLDTNVCIRFLNNSIPMLTARILACLPPSIVLCDIVKAELYYGAEHSSAPEKNLRNLDEFLAGFLSLPFDGRAARIYGRIKSILARRGEPIGPNDLLIAAIALANEVTLVSHNTAEFARIDGLDIEDWELP